MKFVPWSNLFFAERGLTLSQDKTRITHIDDGFDFLGTNIRKYGGKLLIKPSAASIKTFLRKFREILKSRPNVRTWRFNMVAQPRWSTVGLTTIAMWSPSRFFAKSIMRYGRRYGDGRVVGIL